MYCCIVHCKPLSDRLGTSLLEDLVFEAWESGLVDLTPGTANDSVVY